MEEIIIDIEKDGSMKVDVRGVTGPDCEGLTKALEEAVGEVTSRQRKREYHERPLLKRKAGA